jgi:hypothetical protein
MLVSFDIDCGPLVAIHRFIARGICDQGIIDHPDHDIPAPGFSLEYELVPGIPPTGDSREFFRYLVGIEYEADVPLPWEPNDGGAIAPFSGGMSTHGSRGDWPLPRLARFLRFTITGINEVTGWQRDDPDGVLVVDLQDESAHWEPSN